MKRPTLVLAVLLWACAAACVVESNDATEKSIDANNNSFQFIQTVRAVSASRTRHAVQHHLLQRQPSLQYHASAPYAHLSVATMQQEVIAVVERIEAAQRLVVEKDAQLKRFEQQHKTTTRASEQHKHKHKSGFEFMRHKSHDHPLDKQRRALNRELLQAIEIQILSQQELKQLQHAIQHKQLVDAVTQNEIKARLEYDPQPQFTRQESFDSEAEPPHQLEARLQGDQARQEYAARHEAETRARIEKSLLHRLARKCCLAPQIKDSTTLPNEPQADPSVRCHC